MVLKFESNAEVDVFCRGLNIRQHRKIHAENRFSFNKKIYSLSVFFYKLQNCKKIFVLKTNMINRLKTSVLYIFQSFILVKYYIFM